MGVTYREVAERAREVALHARREAMEMDLRRAALARSALVWWQGEAADSYSRRVQERVNALARLSVALMDLARTADRLAEGATARAEAEAAAAWVSGGAP